MGGLCPYQQKVMVSQAIPFSRVPTIKPLPVAEMSQADCDLLRNWASSYGAAVRQRTVRQETTMAKHGTLPEFIYQRQCVTSDKPIAFALGQDDERLDNAEVDDEEIEDDFNSSSDEEVADEDGNGGDSFLQGEIGSSATFLFGATFLALIMKYEESRNQNLIKLLT